MTPAAAAVKAEAYRVVPGVLAARTRNDHAGERFLMQSFFEGAQAHDVTMPQAMALLYRATMDWSAEMVSSLAKAHDMSEERVCQQIAAEAAAWMSEEHGVGGF